MEDKDEKDNPYWAPVNFIDWSNDYRLPAVLSFSVFFGALILWMAIGWPVFKKIRNSLEEKGHKEVGRLKSYVFFEKAISIEAPKCEKLQNRTVRSMLLLKFNFPCHFNRYAHVGRFCNKL